MATKYHDERSGRVAPELVDVLHRDHADRYRFAGRFVRGKKVLEIGCGFGYGTVRLAEEAAEVDAIDLFQGGLDYARQSYCRSNLRFRRMDGCELDFSDKSFDVVIAFEVIEHVERPPEFLEGIRRVLVDGGIAILSTPNGRLSMRDGKPSDPTHLREYSPDEFQAELAAAGFSGIGVHGQVLSAGVWQMHELAASASRADILGIRRLISPTWKRRLLGALARFRYGVAAERFATTSIGSDLSRAHVQLVVCRKGAA